MTETTSQNFRPDLPPTGGRVMPRRALISLSDKSGLENLASCLKKHGIEVISTGGTADALRGMGLSVRDVAEVTGFPECLDGRVKTLHPKIHGGILAKRDDPTHVETQEKLGLESIDLVIISLYPFAQKCAEYEKILAQTTRDGVAVNSDAAAQSLENVIEAIDIGGPSLIRGAAKNHKFVTVITEPAFYPNLIAALDQGGTSLSERQAFAAAAFSHTASYDAKIAAFCHREWGSPPALTHKRDQTGQNLPDLALPQDFTLSGNLVEKLAYGENPHQIGGFYRLGGGDQSEEQFGLASAQQLQGKSLSYNNLNDADLAWALAVDLQTEFADDAGWSHAAVIVKHATPCGVAIAANMENAFTRAYDSDPLSAYGGVVALNGRIDLATAHKIAAHFFEVVMAPAIDPDAAALLTRRQNMRVLITGGLPKHILNNSAPQSAAINWEIRSIQGGFLLQSRDEGRVSIDRCRLVTERAPSEAEKIDLRLAWRVVKFTRSNAIALAKNGQIIGLGGGQTSRVDAVKQALEMAGQRGAGQRSVGAVVASDAFFPFKDGLELCLSAGIKAVIQPGGSKNDAEVIDSAGRHNAAMIFTNMRHFRH
ncbi:MAG: bifunctional phosphoribosylaminoimidazolecarboxamide formyltransferase/IMP cyclohydrolase [Alphaproteobacteria bacterium]|nr:bifunctional phosphoribosylaminoimidazolecarboxamide formyltransferase/IMP cyclohydrolase [Alphaproteobacteria bacterium]